MKTLLAITTLAMFLCTSGCGGDSHESLAGESMATMKELVATFDGIKDKESAKSAKPRLKSLVEKMNSINDRQAKLDAPSEAQVKAIDDKHGKEMEDLQMKMTGHMMRIAFDPKIQAELSDIELKGKS